MASDTLCNYFGKEYYQFVEDTGPFEESETAEVAITSFPGYLGAKEGDELFISLAGQGDGYAPGTGQVCPGGQTASIFRDALCFDDICTSKSVMLLAKFPDPETQIVGKTYKQLVEELVKQTKTNSFPFCGKNDAASYLGGREE
jgi:hypothetical protein